MRRPPHDSPTPDDAIALLRRTGLAALPSVDELAVAHLRAIGDARRGDIPVVGPSRARHRPGTRPRRGTAAAIAAATLVAVPSMAVAGVLPDPVQRVAARVAGLVGVQLPEPARDAVRDDVPSVPGVDGDHGVSEPSGDSAGARGDDPARGGTASAGARDGVRPDAGRGSAVRGTVPGRPETGERRGNRFGQVEAGPDRGQAARPHGGGSSGRPPGAGPGVRPGAGRPAASPRPAAPAPKPPTRGRDAAPGVPEPPVASPPTSVPAAPVPAAPAHGGGAAGGGSAGGGAGRG